MYGCSVVQYAICGDLPQIAHRVLKEVLSPKYPNSF